MPEPRALRAESHMQWAWGRLPKVSSSCQPPSLPFRGSMASVGHLPKALWGVGGRLCTGPHPPPSV